MAPAPSTQLPQEDVRVLKQITDTLHVPDPNIVVRENDLLQIADEIFDFASPSEHTATSDVLIDKPHHQAIPEELALAIQKIACELTCDCSGGDIKGITVAVFKRLSPYAWDSKLALAYTALAMAYGEFNLINHLPITNPLVKSLGLVKHIPVIGDREMIISDLRSLVQRVAKTVIRFIDLPPSDIPHDKPPYSEAFTIVPATVYLGVKSIVFCATQSVGLYNISSEQIISVAEARKRKGELTLHLSNIHVNLQNQLNECDKKIVEIRSNNKYYKLIYIGEHEQTDNMVLIRELMQSDPPVSLPLYSGIEKKRCSLDVLRAREVLLLISRYDVPDDKIDSIKEKTEAAMPRRQYEIVWLPVVEKEIEAVETEEILRRANRMPWYTLHPSVPLDQGVIKFIKVILKLKTMPIIVSLDAHGNVVNPNAYFILMNWGNQAFPFDDNTDRLLWEREATTAGLIVFGNDPTVDQWIKEGKMISFYGGEDDIVWIRRYNSMMKEMARIGGFAIEFIYIGTNLRETISKESMGTCWDDQKVGQFKQRLEILWYSKMKHGQTTVDDPVLKSLTTIIGYGQQGWAMICRGFNEKVTATGAVMVDVLSQMQKDKPSINFENFTSTVDRYINLVAKPSDLMKVKHCVHFDVKNPKEIEPKNMLCVLCNRPMEKVVQYKCCIE